MDSRKAYELMKEDYVDKESAELCNQIEKQLERIISYDEGLLDDGSFSEIKKQAIKLLKEWHL